MNGRVGWLGGEGSWCDAVLMRVWDGMREWEVRVWSPSHITKKPS